MIKTYDHGKLKDVLSELIVSRSILKSITKDGGEGSGNWGHEGRKGKVGGSGKGGFSGYLDDKEVFANPKEHSISQHLDGNGKLKPSRAKLHKNIMKKFFEGIKSTDTPTIFFNGGGSASGKTSAAKSGLFGDVPTVENKLGIVVDPDEIKKYIPEYQQMVESGDPKAAAFVHEESSAIAKMIQARAIRNGSYNVLVDGTLGGNVEKVKSKILKAKKSGLPVNGNFVTADVPVALQRNYERYLKTGRKPSEKELMKNHKAVSNNFEQLGPLFDSCVLVDSNGNPPKKIAEYVNGELKVRDKKAYGRFQAKTLGDDAKILEEFEAKIPEIEAEYYRKNPKY